MSSTDALKAKEQGNAAFKAGQLPEAIGHYTAAIFADRNDPTYPLNRAAAYLKLGKNEDAERDCSTVLRLSPRNVKALFRRAQARFELRNLEAALEDLDVALQIEPNNDAVETELKRQLAFAVNSKAEKARKDAKIKEIVPDNAQSDKAAVSTVPVKRRRVPIEIIEGSVGSTSSPPPQDSRVKSPESSHPKSPPAPAKVYSNSSAVVDTPEQLPNRPKVSGGIFRADGTYTVISSSQKKKPNSKSESSGPVANTSSLKGKATTPPMTLFEFSKDWFSMDDFMDRWQLISGVPPSSLPNLFKTSLEAELLYSILQTFSYILKDGLDLHAKPEIREYLTWFTEVPRFNMVSMFLTAQQKEVAKYVCAAVDAPGIWKL